MFDPNNPQDLAGIRDLLNLQGIPPVHVWLWQVTHHLPQGFVGGGGRCRASITHLKIIILRMFEMQIYNNFIFLKLKLRDLILATLHVLYTDVLQFPYYLNQFVNLGHLI